MTPKPEGVAKIKTKSVTHLPVYLDSHVSLFTAVLFLRCYLI